MLYSKLRNKGSKVLEKSKVLPLNGKFVRFSLVEEPHPYIIVVMCGGQGFYEAGANSAMASIASVVDGYFTVGY